MSRSINDPTLIPASKRTAARNSVSTGSITSASAMRGTDSLRCPIGRWRKLAALASLRQRPIGHLRLSVPRIALALVIEPVLTEFLAAVRFDAGIRVGSLIERDMIAVKLTRDCRWLVVGAPAYFASKGNVRSPEDLVYHDCLGYRFPIARAVQRWQFTDAGREFFVDPRGTLTVNDTASLIALAKRGLGLAYTADILIHPPLPPP